MEKREKNAAVVFCAAAAVVDHHVGILLTWEEK